MSENLHEEERSGHLLTHGVTIGEKLREKEERVDQRDGDADGI